MISIHAPRAGSDAHKRHRNRGRRAISIHAPRAGSDHNLSPMQIFYALFQSTPPVRGATPCYCLPALLAGISIHAPRAGGDLYDNNLTYQRYISIHAPRAGGDVPRPKQPAVSNQNFNPRPPYNRQRHGIHFNPRSPCGERLVSRAFDNVCNRISIHAPRAGSDYPVGLCSRYEHGISIHAPRAGSDSAGAFYLPYFIRFQSTLPVRGATRYAAVKQVFYGISIHAPRAGSDKELRNTLYNIFEFQSTLPVRGATCCRDTQKTDELNFNPRSPCGERLSSWLVLSLRARNFNPRSPCGERLGGGFLFALLYKISIHAPRAGSD